MLYSAAERRLEGEEEQPAASQGEGGTQLLTIPCHQVCRESSATSQGEGGKQLLTVLANSSRRRGGESGRGTQGRALGFPLDIARMEALVAIWLVGGWGQVRERPPKTCSFVDF